MISTNVIKKNLLTETIYKLVYRLIDLNSNYRLNIKCEDENLFMK